MPPGPSSQATGTPTRSSKAALAAAGGTPGALPRHRLLTVFMPLGKLSPEDTALEGRKLLHVEKVAEGCREGRCHAGVLAKQKSQGTWI